jgi:hypothetical protein
MITLRCLAALILLAGLPWPLAAQAQAPTPAQAPADTAPPATEPAPAPARRAPVPPQSFASPEAGFAALAAAIRAHDEPRLLRVLGDAGRRLIRSGDPVADRAARDRFTAAWTERQAILRPAPNRAELEIGADRWPLPVPMIERGGRWRFDARAGAQALVDRRIGRNELDTIETLRAIVDAQQDFARTAGRQGGFRAYAQRFFSSPGARDGLYWPTLPGEPESPLGPLAAAASAGGYAAPRPGDRPQPFHGYLFRMLTRQGPAAPGGAMDFVVDGRMIGGFGVLAVPARHGETGIMSFLVSHDGVVWERNLGPETARLAAAITAFDPGPGWQRVAE